MKLHQYLFLIFLLFLPLQARILFSGSETYVSWYFNYHQAIFLYLTDLVLFLCFTDWLVFDKPERPNNKLFLLILGFLALAGVTLFHVKQVDLGWYQTIKWLEFGMIFTYICGTFKDLDYFRASLLVLYVSSVLQALLAWAQFHMQHMVGLKWLGEYIAPLGTWGVSNLETTTGNVLRAYGTMPHPNVLGGFLVLGLICGLYFVSRPSKMGEARPQSGRHENINRIVIWIGLVVLLIGLFTTFSRTAWIAAMIAIVSFAVFNWFKKQRSTVIVMVIVTTVSCATVGLLYSDSLKARIGNSTTNTVSRDDRKFFNNLGIDLIKQNPLLGVGVGNYVPALLETKHLEPWQYQPPHNIFIFLAAELGIMGLVIFIWLLFEILRRAWSKNIFSNPLVFSLTLLSLLFLLMGQLDHYFVTIQQGRLMLAVALGLVAALPNLNNQETDKYGK